MTHNKRNRFFILVAIFASISIIPQNLSAGNWTTDVNVSFRGAAGTSDYLPFWARTGEEGILPLTSSGLLRAGAKVGFMSKGWFFEAEGDFAGSLSAKKPYSPQLASACINRLYVSGGWKMIRLDVGIAPRKQELDELSLTGGNIIWSANARNLPGVNLWTDWIYFEKGHWFGIRANYAHYQMIDNRYVKNPMVHNKSVAIKAALGRNVDFILGFDHWAQWGGTASNGEKQPSTFKDYLRIVFGKSGGADATLSDQINVLGNHLGRSFLRLVWRTDPFTITYQYDKPFEDGSGMRVQNYPDGIRSVSIALKNRKAIVTDIMYEFANTTWQSGTVHDRPATEEEMAGQDPSDPFYGRFIIGGCDNYFNNGMYASGWTYYGRTIGLPLFIPAPPDSEGLTRGIVSNRLVAHHIGLKGNAYFPYLFKCTFSRNYGRYSQSDSSYFASYPWQISLALEVSLDRLLGKLPLNMSVGLYGDFGEVYKDSFGATLKFGFGKVFN